MSTEEQYLDDDAIAELASREPKVLVSSYEPAKAPGILKVHFNNNETALARLRNDHPVMLIYRSIYGDTTHYAEYDTDEEQYFFEKDTYPSNTLLKSIVPLYGGKVTSRTYKVTTDEYNKQKIYLVKYIPEGKGKTGEISVVKSMLSTMREHFYEQIPEVYYIDTFADYDYGYPIRTNIPNLSLHSAREDDNKVLTQRLVWQEFKEGQSPEQLTDNILTQIAQFQADLHTARPDIEQQTRNLLYTVIHKRPLEERIRDYANKVWDSVKSQNQSNVVDSDALNKLHNILKGFFGQDAMKHIVPQDIKPDIISDLLIRELPKRYNYSWDPLLSFASEPNLYSSPLFSASLYIPIDSDYINLALTAIQAALYQPGINDDGSLSGEQSEGYKRMAAVIESFPLEHTQQIMRESLLNDFPSYSSSVAHKIYSQYANHPDAWAAFLKQFKQELSTQINYGLDTDKPQYNALLNYRKTIANTVDGIDFIASKFEEWQEDVIRFHKKFTNEPIHEDDQNRPKKYGKIEPYNLPKIQRLLEGREETIYNLYSSIPFIKTHGSAANFKKSISPGRAKDFVTAMCQYMQGELTLLQNTINDRLSAIASSGQDIHLPLGYTHGDLHKDNVLFKGGKLSAVIDYETLGIGGTVFDLATTVESMFKEIGMDEAIKKLPEPQKNHLAALTAYDSRAKGMYTRFNGDEMKAIKTYLKAYEEQRIASRKEMGLKGGEFTEAEKSLLPPLILASWLEEAIRRMKNLGRKNENVSLYKLPLTFMLLFENYKDRLMNQDFVKELFGEEKAQANGQKQWQSLYNIAQQPAMAFG